MRPYEWISYLVSNLAPDKVLRHIGRMLRWSGSHQEARHWVGSVLFFSWLCAVIIFLAMWVLTEIVDPLILVGISFAALVLVFFIFYFLLYISVEDRRKRVERVLPDMLQMVSANTRAGVTPIVALRMAARPEFGPLEDEIKYATTKALGTESFTDALLGMSETIKSEVLERTIGLFAASMRSGGNLASLLDLVAEEIREAQELRRELIAGTSMYIIFILFTMIIGMPLLLSISIQFVSMVESMQAKGSGGEFAHELGLAIQAPISATFIEQAALVSLIFTALFASMLVGVIHDGSEWYGLRYAPLFIIASSLIFFLLKGYVLRMILGSMA